MARLELEVKAELLKNLRDLVELYYGDGGEAALGRLVEAAIEMRLLWASRVAEGRIEVEEPISQWEFVEAPGVEQLPDDINDWMFKRGQGK